MEPAVAFAKAMPEIEDEPEDHRERNQNQKAKRVSLGGAMRQRGDEVTEGEGVAMEEMSSGRELFKVRGSTLL